MTANLAQIAARVIPSDELDLVHTAQNGDIPAFEQLVARYDRKLLRIAQHVTHNCEDAQDVVQEAFLKAFRHLGSFREDSQFSTWLIRITLNQAVMKLRKQRATKEVSLGEDLQAEGEILPREIADWAPNFGKLYQASELRDLLSKTLAELHASLRAAFVLRDIEGLSIVETAEVMGLSQSAVKARLWRAWLQLRERLNKYFSKGNAPARAELGSKQLNFSRLLANCLST